MLALADKLLVEVSAALLPSARGRFVWLQATNGSLALTPAQLSMLLEGIDWRMPGCADAPRLAA